MYTSEAAPQTFANGNERLRFASHSVALVTALDCPALLGETFPTAE